jgi:hypothetical protein
MHNCDTVPGRHEFGQMGQLGRDDHYGRNLISGFCLLCWDRPLPAGAATSHADDDDPLRFRPVRLLDKHVHVIRIASEQHDWGL